MEIDLSSGKSPCQRFFPVADDSSATSVSQSLHTIVKSFYHSYIEVRCGNCDATLAQAGSGSWPVPLWTTRWIYSQRTTE